MAINIKNGEVNDLILRLRELTGLGPTEIVKAALEREYQAQRRQRRQRRQVELEAQLPQIQAAASQKAKPFNPDVLYDENGLPQ